MPSVQSPETIRAKADLLRREAAAIGLAGVALVEVCEQVIVDVRAETAAIDGAVGLDASSKTSVDG